MHVTYPPGRQGLRPVSEVPEAARARQLAQAVKERIAQAQMSGIA